MKVNTCTVQIPTGKEVPMLDGKGAEIIIDGEKQTEPELREISIRFSDPNFEQMQGALMAMESPSGKSNRLAAGNFLIEACVLAEDRDTWADLKKDPKAQAAVALEGQSILTVYNAELKKK